MPQFSPVEQKIAIAPMSNPTAKDFSYTAELYLGLPKAATSGVVSFSLAAGEARDISFPVTMPDVEGTYPVYLDIYCNGELIGAYQATEDVVIEAAIVTGRIYLWVQGIPQWQQMGWIWRIRYLDPTGEWIYTNYSNCWVPMLPHIDLNNLQFTVTEGSDAAGFAVHGPYGPFAVENGGNYTINVQTGEFTEGKPAGY